MTKTSSFRKWLKRRFDAIENNNLKKNILNTIPFWAGAFITGLVSVFYTRLFNWAESGAAFIHHHSGWWLLILTPICFLISWWLVVKFSPYSRGSGIPQVSAAIELTNPKSNEKVNVLLSLKVIFIKITSSLVMIFGGGVIGREGPTIQIAASVFKKINDLLPAWYPKISKRNMIVTGAASGLAAAFNTPLGGIVFAIEELTKTHFNFFKSALLTGVIIAGMTALSLLGPYLYLGYPDLEKISSGLILLIIPVAIISGIAGSGMGRMILALFSLKKKIKSKFGNIAYPLLCGFAVALIGYYIAFEAMGSGKELIQGSLFSSKKHIEWYMPVFRIIGPVLSFSSGGAGGIFAPSLSAGASIGGFWAGFFHLPDPEINLLILAGMVGCLTGITRSPFTSSILVIEMTNSHNIIFHLMLSALLANIISNLVSKHSFYDHLKNQYIHEINNSEP